MSDFFSNLLARNEQSVPRVRPRPRSLYEPLQQDGAGSGGMDFATSLPAPSEGGVMGQGEDRSPVPPGQESIQQPSYPLPRPQPGPAERLILPGNDQLEGEKPGPALPEPGMQSRPAVPARVNRVSHENPPVVEDILPGRDGITPEFPRSEGQEQRIPRNPAEGAARDHALQPENPRKPQLPEVDRTIQVDQSTAAEGRAIEPDLPLFRPRNPPQEKAQAGETSLEAYAAPGAPPLRTGPTVRPAGDQPLPPSTEPGPTIEVTIGRIEVRATPLAAAAEKKGKKPAFISLDEYLRQQKGGQR